MSNRNLLQDPPVVESVDGFLNITLTLESARISNDVFTMTTRTFNGSLPGPTLVVSPGDTLNINFINNLPDQGIPYKHNEFSAPDETNLHFHGLHVSGELPSDDATLVIGPGESFQYTTTLPDNHMPGLHWLHPHRHGSTALQVGGGAAAAIVVRDVAARDDTDNTEMTSMVPDIYNDETQIPSRILVVQPMEFRALRDVLLAKDGIYLSKIPRQIVQASVVPAGRSDLLVSCPSSSTSYQILQGNTLLATIDTSAPDDNSTGGAALEDLPEWNVEYPDYLQDLQMASVDPGCSCPTKVGPGGGINGFLYDEDHTVHHYQLGKVVEREIAASRHPYHQHVYPFQLVNGFGESIGRDSDGEINPYYQLGDWHDTMDDRGTIRYLPTNFASKIMLHCHRLDHEDKGMMNMERHADFCECGPMKESFQEGLETWLIAVIAAAALLVLCGGGGFILFRRKRSNDSEATD